MRPPRPHPSALPILIEALALVLGATACASRGPGRAGAVMDMDFSDSLPPAPPGAAVPGPRPMIRGGAGSIRPHLALAAASAPAGQKAEGSSVVAAEAEAPKRAPVVIYTAQFTMAVLDVRPGLAAIELLARDLGGFMGKQTDDAITIRIPAARFHEAVARVEKIGDVLSRDINAEDVTEAYLDLEVRLKSARAVRDRLEHLLARATKVEESIAVERELERVVGEIERLEGRLRFMQERAQFSTISVTFAAHPREVVAGDAFRLPFPWLDQLGLSRLLELK
jgi:hypothetical protein